MEEGCFMGEVISDMRMLLEIKCGDNLTKKTAKIYCENLSRIDCPMCL